MSFLSFRRLAAALAAAAVAFLAFSRELAAFLAVRMLPRAAAAFWMSSITIG